MSVQPESERRLSDARGLIQLAAGPARFRGVEKRGVSRDLLRPASVVLISLALSVVWCLIPVSGVGSTGPDVSFLGILLLVAWYGGIVLAASAGYAIGKRLPLMNGIRIASHEMAGYALLTGVAAIGLTAVLATLGSGGISFIIDSIAKSQANLLKKRLYEDYSAGLFTLRYAAVPTGAIALYRLVFGSREPGLRKSPLLFALDALNVAFLGATALISSRLAVVCCLVLVAHLSVVRGTVGVLRIKPLILIFVCVGTAMTFFNYSRNANFYKKTYGAENPVEMQLIELKRYIGEPFRVTLSCATIIAAGNADRAAADLDWQDAVLPTFFREHSAPTLANDVRWYHNLVDVDRSLTANSAFVDIVPTMGMAAFPFIFAVSFACAICVAWLPRHGFLPTLSGGAILYGFAELWRLFLFNEGVLIFLVLAPIATAAIVRLITNSRASGMDDRRILSSVHRS